MKDVQMDIMATLSQLVTIVNPVDVTQMRILAHQGKPLSMILLSHVWLKKVNVQATNIQTLASNNHSHSPPLTFCDAKIVCSA